MLHEVLTNSILSAFYENHRELGHGFLESVYEQSMVIALESRGLDAIRQAPVTVHYNAHPVGTFYADLVVEQAVIVELKAGQVLHAMHEAQLLNYLRATRFEVGLLLHFAPKPAFRRLIFTNDRKRHLNVGSLPRPSVAIPSNHQAK
jgi:GxxExxY protein